MAASGSEGSLRALMGHSGQLSPLGIKNIASDVLDRELVAVNTAGNSDPQTSISSCKPAIMARLESDGLSTDEASKCADQVAHRLGNLLRDQGVFTVDCQQRIRFRKEPGGNKPYKPMDGSAFRLQLRPAASAADMPSTSQQASALNYQIPPALNASEIIKLQGERDAEKDKVMALEAKMKEAAGDLGAKLKEKEAELHAATEGKDKLKARLGAKM
jgi:hypothetical protein